MQPPDRRPAPEALIQESEAPNKQLITYRGLGFRVIYLYYSRHQTPIGLRPVTYTTTPMISYTKRYSTPLLRGIVPPSRGTPYRSPTPNIKTPFPGRVPKSFGFRPRRRFLKFGTPSLGFRGLGFEM